MTARIVSRRGTQPNTDADDATETRADEVNAPTATAKASPCRDAVRLWQPLRSVACSWVRMTRRWYSNLYRRGDPSSLAVFRASFGFLMLLDIPHERGFSMADLKWGNADMCHFPLIHSMQPLPYEWMCVVYSVMWIGALGIALGYHFRLSCWSFCLTYWYVVLLDKSSWNNHTYLYGLIGFLLCFTSANACWSVDQRREATATQHRVPLWNYSILRFQTFVLYFMAGLKKVDLDWLCGHSMTNLSQHWVFSPFRFWFTAEQVDLWIVHVTGFAIDSFAGFGLQFEKTRPLTLAFLFAFHFMNSRMFQIGVFPYVGIATMFVFCDYDWPKKLLNKITATGLRTEKKSEMGPGAGLESEPEPEHVRSTSGSSLEQPAAGRGRRLAVAALIVLYAALQLFLPFSHFITQGYNNGWTNGLYGYSWDMMVHSWDNSMDVIKVVDGENGHEFYLNADDWALNKKWMKHPDMLIQFARCARRNLRRKTRNLSDRIAITVDFWFSLNGRFHQRMFDPRVDLLTAKWSPFEKVPWVMPLLTELSDWRTKLGQIRDDAYGRANHTEVIFVADFPGLVLENYVNEDLSNVTLSLLKGRIEVTTEDGGGAGNDERVASAAAITTVLEVGDQMPIRRGAFHRIRTVSPTPSCYMYSYCNATLAKAPLPPPPPTLSPAAQVRDEMETRWADVRRSFQLAVDAFFTIIGKYASHLRW